MTSIRLCQFMFGKSEQVVVAVTNHVHHMFVIRHMLVPNDNTCAAWHFTTLPGYAGTFIDHFSTSQTGQTAPTKFGSSGFGQETCVRTLLPPQQLHTFDRLASAR